MQDNTAVKIHPLDLSQYGLNPDGEPIYRVVWADSRVEKAEKDGRIHEIQLYEGIAQGKWVLEKWIPVELYLGMTAEQYREKCRQEGVAMEIPVTGTYQMAGGVFPGEVTARLAHLWASQINFDQANFTPADRARAYREAYEESLRLAEQKKDEVIYTALERTNA